MTIQKIELEIQLTEEHLAKLKKSYEVCNSNDFYENFEEFLNVCMDFRALHHLLDSASRLEDWSRQFEHCEQT